MKNKDSLKSVIAQVNSGKSYPALKLVEDNPEIAALISKLVKPLNASDFDISRKSSQDGINQSQLQAISELTKTRAKDNESILQLFPDIELAVQILVSSVLSPKDMVKTDIIYKAKENILPSELTMKLNEIVVSNFEHYYNISEQLPDILRDTLFNTGSFIKVVIPESTVDEIINGNQNVSVESFKDIFSADSKVPNLNILGNSGKPSKLTTAMESFVTGNAAPVNYDSSIKYTTNDGKSIALEGIEVTDNFNFLKLPKVLEAVSRSRVKSIIGRKKYSSVTAGLESDHKLTTLELSTLTYKGPKTNSQTFLTIPGKINAKRKSIGRPLVMDLPSESVIPVYVPGNESKHIGCFCLVDADGNPVSRNGSDTSNEGLQGLMSNGNSSLSSMLLDKAKRNLTNNDKAPTMDHITKVYSSIAENDFMERLNNGIYGKGVAIANNEEIYRIMLARQLSSKFTRIIYIPAELTTYFAFKYFANGIGKSYLDEIKNLTSMRGIILFSKIMAMVKSAISLTNVNITLDPQDPDPEKTIEIAQHEVGKMRQNLLPLGTNNSPDLLEWIQRAGLNFSFEGHPGLPQTKLDFETKNMQHTVPDTEMDEMLRKQTYMAFGLSPETIDAGLANPEFATTIVENNVLYSKRVIQLQNKFSTQLTDWCHKLMSNDPVVIKELGDVLAENIGIIETVMTDEDKTVYNANPDGYIDDLIERYLINLQLELPRPDVTSVQTQTSAFNEYADAMDKNIDYWISSEFITSDLAGEISSNIDSIKANIKAYYMRRWMSDNGYMTELNDLVTASEDGKPTIDLYEINQAHMEGLIRSATRFIANLKPMADAANTDLQNLGTPEGETTDSGSGDTGEGDEGSGGDGDFGSMDGMDDIPVDGADTPEADPVDDSTEPKEETPKDDEDKVE